MAPAFGINVRTLGGSHVFFTHPRVREGARVLETSPGVSLDDGVVRWSGLPVEPTDVWVRYELAA